MTFPKAATLALGILAGFAAQHASAQKSSGARWSERVETTKSRGKSSGQNYEADNTGKNKRDRKAGEPTADGQKENASDLELTQKIRQAVYKDDSLSMSAHNVKIVARDGHVTLKGPVDSQREKQVVESAAAKVAGRGHVTNEIEVKSDSKKKQ